MIKQLIILQALTEEAEQNNDFENYFQFNLDLSALLRTNGQI